MGRLKDKTLSQQEARADEPQQPQPGLMSYREYYDKYGYLPPGFSIEIDGETIHGGCAKWREWADSQGYPQEPPPWGTKQQKDEWETFLRRKYRPWL